MIECLTVSQVVVSLSLTGGAKYAAIGELVKPSLFQGEECEFKSHWQYFLYDVGRVGTTLALGARERMFESCTSYLQYLDVGKLANPLVLDTRDRLFESIHLDIYLPSLTVERWSPKPQVVVRIHGLVQNNNKGLGAAMVVISLAMRKSGRFDDRKFHKK